MELNYLFKKLESISYETKLEKNLKNTLRKVDKDILINELIEYRSFLINNCEILKEYPFRIKSIHSIKLKYDRYFPSKEISSCFNDILSIRLILEDYNIEIEGSNTRIVNMTNGKKSDDGFRGLHIYYQKSKYHYPIEIQIFTKRDYIFNVWLHKYVYKYKDKEVGIYLRELYDKGQIKDEKKFMEVLEGVSSIN